jgi:hypothetical protein
LPATLHTLAASNRQSAADVIRRAARERTGTVDDHEPQPAGKRRVVWGAVVLVMVLSVSGGYLLFSSVEGYPQRRRLSETCRRIAWSARYSAGVSRSDAEYLAEAARRDPSIRAFRAAREVRRIAGRQSREWPVIEVDGAWFILQNKGHPAADGCFAVTVVDVETKRVVGTVADSTGNAPVPAPVGKIPRVSR